MGEFGCWAVLCSVSRRNARIVSTVLRDWRDPCCKGDSWLLLSNVCLSLCSSNLSQSLKIVLSKVIGL
jgi:hypothetical protein